MDASYRGLLIWQKSIKLVKEIYNVTKKFPKEEIYGLTSQMRRATVSIPTNIAGGSRRFSQKDFRNFLRISFASGAELETLMEIALDQNYIDDKTYKKLDNQIGEVQKMINSFIKNMKV